MNPYRGAQQEIKDSAVRGSLREVLDYLESRYDGAVLEAARATALACHDQRIDGNSYETCYIGHLMSNLGTPHPTNLAFYNLRENMGHDPHSMLLIEWFVEDAEEGQPDDGVMRAEEWTWEWLAEHGYQEV